jgi:hypothetical protein
MIGRTVDPSESVVSVLRLRRKEGSKSIRPYMSQAEAAERIEYPEDVDRPRTRGDCAGGERPCPFVSCKYHLYLDVAENGTIKVNHPTLEPWELTDSCALDIADQGPATLNVVANALNVVRERVRQIEHQVLVRLERAVR